MIKEALGLEPQKTEDGAYIPSTSSLKMATKETSNYEPQNIDQPYTRNKKVMVVCTEEGYMTMENGKKFKTGNHPIELFVPILWLNDAGFEIDIYTAHGESVAIEEWAFPEYDKHVTNVRKKYNTQLQSPKSLQDLASTQSLNVSSDYIALFIPGGHGALLGLPEFESLGKILQNAFDKDLFILSICHGPGAFLSANTSNNKEDYLFNGYKIAAFPDSADAMLPKMGYLPGDMTWKFNKALEKLGVEIVNALPDKTTHKDRKLLTAAGPLAANNFGKLIVEELLGSEID